MAERQLSNTKFYVKLRENPTLKYSEEISDILYKMFQAEEISETVYKYLLPTKNVRTPVFYFLPKIHKKKVVGRPIISGNEGPTEKISAFVDAHIKQYVTTLPSYVKDTTDFIRKLRNLPPTNQRILLVTMDVSSLYTNIPNHEGKRAIYKTLREHNYSGQASIKSLMELLECVLHKNNFEFNGENYLQIGGTAMGTILAPNYSVLFLGELEKKLLNQAPCKPDLYLRYIDDIFCVFTKNQQQVEEFIEFMNSAHPTIKFTHWNLYHSWIPESK